MRSEARAVTAMRAAMAVGAALVLGGCTTGPVGLLEEASSATSQTLCSAVFVTGVKAEGSLRLELMPEPSFGIAAMALHYDVDRDKREVRTTIGGGFESRAVFAAGRGCTLAYDGYTAAPLKPAPVADAVLPEIAGADVVAPRDPKLKAAIDGAFADATAETAAVVVVRDGQVIGERYRDGYGVDTQILGHSLAKSVVNGLIGILVRQGKLDVHAVADVPAWKGAHDPRGEITIEQLMRMDAGFGFDEGTGVSIATHIWYTQPDTAAASAQSAQLTAPNTFGYSSRSYMLLARIVGQTIGGGPQGLRDFAQRELFGPLGMRHVTLEFDAAGTMMGAQAALASARDWAKFGLLYLNDGAVGGQRILPEGWVKFTTTPTLDSGYGAGFWLNNTHSRIAQWDMPWGIAGAPADAFFARGYMGQYIVVVPSQKLVVVRFGYSHGHSDSTDGTGRLVHDTIAALPARTAQGQ